MRLQDATDRTRSRCAVHPSRPAVDACPVCARPRCGTDAARAPGGGCVACQGSATGAVRAEPEPVEQLVRAALACTLVALLGGLVVAEYVEAGLFAYVAPLVAGVLVGAAALRAAPSDGRGPRGARVRGLATAYAVLGTSFGFLLEGSQDALATGVLLPYACAAAGALLWTQPVQRRAEAG